MSDDKVICVRSKNGLCIEKRCRHKLPHKPIQVVLEEMEYYCLSERYCCSHLTKCVPVEGEDADHAGK